MLHLRHLRHLRQRRQQVRVQVLVLVDHVQEIIRSPLAARDLVLARLVLATIHLLLLVDRAPAAFQVHLVLLVLGQEARLDLQVLVALVRLALVPVDLAVLVDLADLELIVPLVLVVLADNARADRQAQEPAQELAHQLVQVVQVEVVQPQVVAVKLRVLLVAREASPLRLVSQSGQSVKSGTTCRPLQWVAPQFAWVRVKLYVWLVDVHSLISPTRLTLSQPH